MYQDSADRSKRAVTTADRSITVQKPLGLVLEEGQDGMVFVSEIDPDGNAAGEDINEGDIVVAVSATFGDEVWSTRGVGLDRVLKSIRIRSGQFVTLVLESADQVKERKDFAVQSAQERRQSAREKFGEREVLNPVTWTADKGNQKNRREPIYEDNIDGDRRDDAITNELKEKLKKEVVAPYQQNWLLWITGGVLVLIVLSVITGVLK